MVSISVDIPLSFRILNQSEVKAIFLHMVQDKFRKDTVASVVSKRYTTKRAANSVARRIAQHDVAFLLSKVNQIRDSIDFSKPYTLHVDQHIHSLYVRQ